MPVLRPAILAALALVLTAAVPTATAHHVCDPTYLVCVPHVADIYGAGLGTIHQKQTYYVDGDPVNVKECTSDAVLDAQYYAGDGLLIESQLSPSCLLGGAVHSWGFTDCTQAASGDISCSGGDCWVECWSVEWTASGELSADYLYYGGGFDSDLELHFDGQLVRTDAA